MAPRGGLKRVLKLGAVGAAAALALAACGSSSPSSSNSGNNTTTTKPAHIKRGGVAYWAEGPGASPNWIFPFASLTYFSVANLTQFQELMFRPLYFFGQITSSAPTVDFPQGPADAPTWSNGNKTLTIHMKGWQWSNGEKVDAQDVMFWMNMIKAEKANWAGYVPGNFPDNVKSYSVNASADTITMNLDKAYSTNWYLYNELSQITPMPLAWDITKAGAAPGSGGCSTIHPTAATISANGPCAKVWTFLTDDGGKAKSPAEAGDLATYATNPLWQVVDGPWHLTAFTSLGRATFAPNTKYSGPQKPYLSQFIELPYTSDDSEYHALEGGGSGAPTVGYIPTQDVPAYGGKPGGVGQNASSVASSYSLVPVFGWSINYFPENFNSNGYVGAIFKQLYFRQALQMMINQPLIIKSIDKGYGVPTYGPVPVLPKNPFTSPQEANNPYPYNPTKAKSLLTSHGWTIHPNGIDTCSSASKCGAGIPSGAQLNFNELYANGILSVQQTVQAEVSAWSSIGIHVTTKSTTFDNVLTTAIPCKHGASDCSWQFGNWGGGWIYAPDYLPTGGEIFATGAGSNSGSYNDPKNDALIEKTHTSSSLKYFFQYENYLAQQLPVVWQPNPANELLEVSKTIGGVTPVNALLNLTPEYWYKTS